MEAGLVARIEGTGTAAVQTPSPGEIIERGSAVRVVLEAPTWHEPALTSVDEGESQAPLASITPRHPEGR